MANLTDQQIDQIFEACRSKVQSLAQSLSTNLGTEVQLEPGEEGQGTFEILNQVSEKPGIAITLQFDGFGVVCLIPDSLPLPDWYRSPDEAQKSQLQALSAEWSSALLPSELETTQLKAVRCENLRTHLRACQPTDDVRLLELSATAPGGGGTLTAIHFVMPVAVPLLEGFTGKDEPTVETLTGNSMAVDETAATIATDIANERSQNSAIDNRKQRINKIPVSLIVRIADRQMDLQQLRAIAPGTLLMFDKTYDSLLDVYIGNRLYCRGEAVKVGENFGIKINECNAQVIREKKVHQV
ncbi:MAG: FliM/FliN family flagellar motor switch protein [Planctomycetota bacterium]|nr:FliM/FliN family flagellar motor switch protein [Planctomycetota bacterium]